MGKERANYAVRVLFIGHASAVYIAHRGIIFTQITKVTTLTKKERLFKIASFKCKMYWKNASFNFISNVVISINQEIM